MKQLTLTPRDAFAKLELAANLVQARLKTVPKWRNWQTRMVQVHVLARVWRFKSSLRHQKFSSRFETPRSGLSERGFVAFAVD